MRWYWIPIGVFIVMFVWALQTSYYSLGLSAVDGITSSFFAAGIIALVAAAVCYLIKYYIDEKEKNAKPSTTNPKRM